MPDKADAPGGYPILRGAKPTALAALDQHDTDQRKGDEQMNDQQNGGQRVGLPGWVRMRWIGRDGASYPARAA